jgi:hypothetical protein
VATGTIIGLLDGDDVWIPERVERCVEVLETREDVSWVTTDATLIDEDGNALGQSYCDQVPFPASQVAQGMARRNVVYGSPLVWRSVLDQSGPYDESLTHGAEDYDLWLRFIAQGVTMVTIPEELALYRIRTESLTRVRGGLSEPTSLVLERHLPSFWIDGIYGSSNEAFRIAARLARRRQWRRSAQFFRAAFRDPERTTAGVVGAVAQSASRSLWEAAARLRPTPNRSPGLADVERANTRFAGLPEG